MTILIIALVLSYALLAFGYEKMVGRAVPDFAEEYRLTVAIVSLIWPVAIVYTLAKEALT